MAEKAEKEDRCPLCKEILILEDDDCIVNSQGLSFCLECWTELDRMAKEAGFDADDIVAADLEPDMDHIALKLTPKGGK